MPPKRKTAAPPITTKRSKPSSSSSSSSSSSLPSEYIEFWTAHTANKPVEKPYRPARLFRRSNGSAESPALISLAAYTRLCNLYNAMTAQNPGLGGPGVSMATDAEGDAQMEVLRGQLAEYQKTPRWEIAEALAFLVLGEEDEGWLSVDDSDEIAELVTLIGALFLDAVQALGEREREVKNLALVMGTMCGLADAWEVINHEREVAWGGLLEKIAEKKGIKMLIVTHTIEPYETPDDDEDERDKKEQEKDKEKEKEKEKGEDEDKDEEKYDFMDMMKAYRKRFGSAREWNKFAVDLTKPAVRAKIEKTIRRANEG